jgi:hypothetical protein
VLDVRTAVEHAHRPPTGKRSAGRWHRRQRTLAHPAEGSQVFQGERLIIGDRVHRYFLERRADGLFQELQQG